MIALAQKYKVKMPVLTAVARIIDNELTPTKAVFELMNLPQVAPMLNNQFLKGTFSCQYDSRNTFIQPVLLTANCFDSNMQVEEV